MDEPVPVPWTRSGLA